MQPDTSPIDLQQLIPSLFTTLALLKHDPYEAGWLLGCVNDVAHCFITAHARASNSGGINNPLSSACEPAISYLRDLGPSDGPDNAVAIGSFINIDELISVVGVIHAAHALANWSWTTSFTAVNGEYEVLAAIDEMDARFVSLLYQAVIDFMFEGDAERMDVALLDWGWSDGKSASGLRGDETNVEAAREVDDESCDEDITTGLPVQFTPDDTPTEHTATGPKVPSEMFCLPYNDGSRPEGACAICCYHFTDPEVKHRSIVLARCRVRHPFHGDCLDEWVNNSSMENANRCPHDREMLCERRERVHIGNI